MKTSEKAQHTETPWVLASEADSMGQHPDGSYRPRTLYYLHKADNTHEIAKLNECDAAKADGHFIVRAVNAHDELLEAAKAALASIRQGAGTSAEIRLQLRDAIVKAEGRA